MNVNEQIREQCTKELIGMHDGSSVVWKAWRDKMIEQGRLVKEDFLEWPIPFIDQQLDKAVAEAVVTDFLAWVKERHGLILKLDM